MSAPKANPPTLADILADRGAKYGPYIGHAKIACRLKEVMHQAVIENRKMMAPDQMETLDMIAHKIGRILNGDPDYEDSWRDIAGYATLVADRLLADQRPPADNSGLLPGGQAIGSTTRAADEGRVSVPSVIEEIAAERRRQVCVEDWTPEHDDEHDTGALAAAAACYALEACAPAAENDYWRERRRTAARELWPWDYEWRKPKGSRRDLVRAAALIVAEIERLDRLAAAEKEKGS